jgi:acetyltransferase EpsM
MSDRAKLAVLGAGGFATEVMEAATLVGWKSFELYDDDPAKKGGTFLGSRCVGSIADFEHSPRSNYILAIGNNSLRQHFGERLQAKGHTAIRLIHPSTVISPTAQIGEGSFLGPFVWVGPQVRIGRHALINMGASIGHDAVLADWVQLCPGARVSGFSNLGNGAFMGSNAVLAPSVGMEEWSQLAATSFAWRTIPARALAAGCPARIAQTL